MQKLPKSQQSKHVTIIMSSLTFYIVDVFAEVKYTGNQLAVFTNATGIKTEEMQAIAKEINYSETTFVTSSQVISDSYNVRIFTQSQELPFAGHPTLGTAFILQKEIIQQQINQILLNLKVGQIPVTFDYVSDLETLLWMQQKAPTFHQILTEDTIAEILCLDTVEIDSRFPIQEVSTGVPFIIVPLKTHAALKRIKVNKEKYWQLIEKTQAKSILAFCPETYNQKKSVKRAGFRRLFRGTRRPSHWECEWLFGGLFSRIFLFWFIQNRPAS